MNIPNAKITEVTTFNGEGYREINIEHKNISHNIIIYDNDKIGYFKENYLKYWHKQMPLYKINVDISVDREIETIEDKKFKICKLSQTDDFDYVIVDKES